MSIPALCLLTGSRIALTVVQVPRALLNRERYYQTIELYFISRSTNGKLKLAESAPPREGCLPLVP